MSDRENSEYQEDGWERLSFGAKFVIVTIAGIALVLIGFSPAVEKPAEFVITSILAMIVALIGLNQYYVSKRQWHSMRSGLERTDSLLDQNEQMIEASKRQAKASEQSLKMAQEHLELVERPSLGVELIEVVMHRFEPKGAIVATIRNSGRSPAVNIEMFLTPNFYKVEEIEPNSCPDPHEAEIDPIGLDSCGVLPSNATNLLMSAQFPYEPVMKAIQDGSAYVMIWIRIKYKSIYGREFETEYYARYNAQTAAVVCGSKHNRAT
jgi:hypothetical protein